MKKAPTQEVFLKDVAKHEMLVKLDSGVYRHIVFRRPDNSNHWFEIVTYPEKLVISGDMGTWAFSRVEDMFTFFRTDSGEINAHYWSEKLVNGVHGGVNSSMVYDGDAYRERLIGSLDEYGMDDDRRAGIVREMRSFDFDDEHWIVSTLNDFDHDGFTFQDLWEIDMKVYSCHFIWCLYAIVYGIGKYDAMKANP